MPDAAVYSRRAPTEYLKTSFFTELRGHENMVLGCTQMELLLTEIHKIDF
jgi:hypothetical protein